MNRFNRVCAFGQFAWIVELILKVKPTRERVFESLLRHHYLFLGWLSHECLMLFAFSLSLESDDVVQPSAHILVVKVRTCLRVLVLSAGVVVEVDSLVVIVVEAMLSRRVGLLIFNVFIGLFLHLGICFVVIEVILLVVAPNICANSSRHLKQSQPLQDLITFARV